MRGERASGLVFALGALVALGGVGLVRAQEPSAEDLARETAKLELRLEAAKEDGTYLVLHQATDALVVMLQSVTLREIAVLDADVGAPRTLFMTRKGPRDLAGRIWRAGRVDPPLVVHRREIIVEKIDPDPTGQEEIVPPTPQEAYPAPERFRVRFEGGLEMLVLSYRGPEGERASARLGSTDWFRERWETLWPSKASPLRLRLLLDAKDAAELWRSLPQDGVRLLVEP